MKYALNLSEDGRILSATFEKYAAPGMVLADTLPDGDITEYRYENDGYVHDPLPESEPGQLHPTEMEQLRADVDYIAMEMGVEL